MELVLDVQQDRDPELLQQAKMNRRLFCAWIETPNQSRQLGRVSLTNLLVFLTTAGPSVR